MGLRVLDDSEMNCSLKKIRFLIAPPWIYFATQPAIFCVLVIVSKLWLCRRDKRNIRPHRDAAFLYPPSVAM